MSPVAVELEGAIAKSIINAINSSEVQISRKYGLKAPNFELTDHLYTHPVFLVRNSCLVPSLSV
jgi:hypothetical protein